MTCPVCHGTKGTERGRWIGWSRCNETGAVEAWVYVITGDDGAVAAVGPFDSRGEAEAYRNRSGGIGGGVAAVAVTELQSPITIVWK